MCGMNGNQPQMFPQPKSKTWLWVAVGVVVLLVLLFAVYYYYYGYTPAPSGDEAEVSAIEQGLEAVDVKGLGSELEDIDKELVQ